MARILIGTVPILGHIHPMLPLARALVARGHELRWYTGAKYREKVSASGARHVGLTHARDYDDLGFDAAFSGRAALSGIDQLKFDMKHIFIDNAPGQLRDLQEIARDFQPDLLLTDPGLIGAGFLAEQTGLFHAILCVLPLVLGSVDTAPFGLGLLPSSGALGRLKNRALRLAIERGVFRGVQKHWNETRKRVGLGPTGYWMDNGAPHALYLQPSVPGFEYPRSDLRHDVRFIGMLPVDAPSGWKAPAFWAELDGKRPIVHVTQGTIANASPQLIAPALEGLANEDVLVVVSTGGRPVESLGLRNVPRNARIATFLSYPELLPKTAAMVTNGGYGGVQMALSHGVPLVVAGTTEDKPEVAARVAWSGAGINLKTSSPTPAAVRGAVRALLDSPGYRTRARDLARQYAQYDAVERALQLIEGSAALRGTARAA